MQILFLISMFIFGACLGSFLCCQARRLHLKEQGKKARTKSAQKLPARSVCLHCNRQLKWFDNLPIISWLILGGRCRNCHHKIGAAELVSELATAVAFVALSAKFLLAHSTSAFAPTPSLIAFSATPLDWFLFALALLLVVLLIFLAIYDALYGELPVLILTISIICAIIILALKDWVSLSISSFSPEAYILKPALALLILPGLYFALYKISNGKWVGDGDWLLALPLALLLADPWLALITLSLANLLACLFSLKSFKNPKKAPKIHLGPFLIAAFLITLTFADFFQSML